MRKNTSPAEGTDGFIYQCRLPLSSATLDLVSGLIRGHLKKIGSRWRKLPPGRIALIALAVLRHDQRLSDMAGGNDVPAPPCAPGCSKSSACSPPVPLAWTAP